MARIDLGKITRLSPATVTAITSDLLAQGMIEGIDSDEPKTQQSRGRPRSLLRLKAVAACVLAVRLSVDRIDISLADFAGDTFGEETVAFDSATADADSFPETLITAIRTFLGKTSIEPAKILEIAVAAQGVVETDSGVVVWSPAFKGRRIPIVKPLHDAFGADCMLSNDTNMITEALHWIDPKRYSGTFAVVMLDYGVGMGLYLNDQLFSGASGKAGEFGHSNHIPGGALCRCGKRGCIEAYLSDYGIVRAAAHLPETTNPAELRAGIDALAALIERADQGDEDALNAFSGAGRVLGFGLAGLLAVMDPTRIVLTGASVRAFRFMEESMREGIREALVEDLRQGFEIDVMPWNEDYIRKGLVAQAMERLDKDFTGMDPVVGKSASGGPRGAAA